MNLTPDHFEAIAEARRAQLKVLLNRFPQVAGPLHAVAIAGSFADMIANSPPDGQNALLEVINAQLVDAGLEVRELPRN